MRRKLDRRDLLKQFGASALMFWPILQASRASAAEAARIKRAVFYFKSSGVIENKFFPTGTQTDFAIPAGAATEPLIPFLKDLQFIKGLSLRSNNGGLADYTGHNALGVFLTSRDFTNGTFPEGISIDQLIAQRMTNDGFKSLQLGWQLSGPNAAEGIMSYAPAPMPAQLNPYAVFDSLFKDLIEARCTPANVEATRRRLKRQSVLDGLTQNLRDAVRLEGFAAEEKAKLDSYAESVRDLEKNLAALTSTAGPDLCASVDQMKIQEGIAFNEWANIPKVSRIMIDLLVAALRFDRTRVVCLSASNGGGNWIPSWIKGPDDKPIADKFHELGHGVIFQLAPGDPRIGTPIPDADAKHNAVDRWYMEDFAYLLDQLKKTMEGSYSLLDNSAVLFTSEMYNAGKDHNNIPSPMILAGGGGGYFKPGQFHNVANRTPHAKLLITMAHSMGLTDVQTFGNPVLNVNGPLAL